MLKITAIMENKNTENKALIAEHGLSFLIQTEKCEFIFDCGSGKNTKHNAEKLNIDIATIEKVICSHSHYDHGGGLKEFIKAGFQGSVYVGEGYFNSKYAFDGLKYTYLGCGYDQSFLEENHLNVICCRDKLKIADNVYIMGGFKNINQVEALPTKFYIEKDDKFLQDEFVDEICCVIDSPKGLIVVVGCSHPGIITMLDIIRDTFKKPIYGLFGGLHLKDLDQSRVQFTVKSMEQYGIKVLGASHCSGEYIKEFATEHTFMKVSSLSVGDSIFIA